MALAPLPHLYPFRFVDTVVRERNATFTDGSVQMTVSAGQRACSGRAWSSPFLLAEAIAQSALLLSGEDPELSRRGFLAGISGFSATRAPESGERLHVDISLVRRLGITAKFRGVVRSRDEEIARGDILVRQGTS